VLGRLGRWCHNRRVFVVAAWLVVLLGLGAATGATGTGFSSEFSLPDVESARGFDVIDDKFDGAGGGQGASIVFRAEQGVTDPAVQAAMTAFLDEVATIPGIIVVSPYSQEGARQIAAQGPDAGLIAYARLDLPQDITLEEATDLREQLDELTSPRSSASPSRSSS
jgi:RND superfamily putative drug exporter